MFLIHQGDKMKKLYILIPTLLIICISSTVYGTTIITHGFKFPPYSEYPPDWTIEMAEAIRERADGGKVLKYDKSSGRFMSFDEYNTDGEVILVFDWGTESNNFSHGYSEAAGDALFAALIQGELFEQFDLDNLHFIGHSRGCSVNSECIERLIAIGIAVDHVTYLDPHDWGVTEFFPDDYDVNPGLNIPYPWDSEPNAGIVSWSGINWADTYWQDALGLSGREVRGTYNYPKLDLGLLGHSDVHEWYLDNTIRPVPEGSDNYSSEGYHYSHIVGGDRSSHPIEGAQTPVQFNFERYGIVNGDFQRGHSPTYGPYPGWEYHGGGGNGHFYNQHLELEWSHEARTHNRFYIPPDATKIWFEYRIWEDDAGTPPNVDRLDVAIDETSISSFNCGNTVKDNLWLNEETSTFTYCSFDIPAEYKGSVSTLKFEIIEGGFNINSEVWIDNVQLDFDFSSCTDNDGDDYNIEGNNCGPIDCNDSDQTINPESTEECDGIDNDCDEEVDEGCTCYDGDTRQCTNAGACTFGTETCSGGVWGDCIGGVQPTPEICDGLDNDCDGLVDESDCVPNNYCYDWKYDPSLRDPPDQAHNYIAYIEYGPYCANEYNWHDADIDNDGYEERYMLVGETYTVWAECQARPTYTVEDFVNNDPAYNDLTTYYGCSDGICDEPNERTVWSYQYNSPSSTINFPDMFCLVLVGDGGHYLWGRNSDYLRRVFANGHRENYLVVYCGTDADCRGDQYCNKPVLSDPTSYRCEPKCGNGVCDPEEECSLDYSGHEICDGTDNDCNGTIDDGLAVTCSSDSNCPSEACFLGTYRNYYCMNPNTCNSSCAYLTSVTDSDGDGYDIECDVDCDDNNVSIHPDAVEICSDGLDNNCNNFTDCEEHSCDGLSCGEKMECGGDGNCYHEADTDRNKIISIGELMDYIRMWKGSAGTVVTISDLIRVIGFWRAIGY